MIDKGKVKRILVITLSNIGDAVLTTPVIQKLRESFPQAHLAVLVGPRAFSVFRSDRRIDKKIIYDKAISWKNKLALVNRLRQDRYDLVVDLRQSIFGICLGTRYRSSIFVHPPKSLTHMKDRHLWRLKTLGLDVDYAQGPTVEFGEDDQIYISQLWNKWQVKDGQIVVAIAPGARNMTKRWEKEGFVSLIERLYSAYSLKIIMIGDERDLPLVEEIVAQTKPRPFNLCGQTSIGQLASLLSRCSLLVSNDSAPMHLGWAVNTPVIAIFGPTDYKKYAPGGQDDVVLRKRLDCAPCEQSLCPGIGKYKYDTTAKIVLSLRSRTRTILNKILRFAQNRSAEEEMTQCEVKNLAKSHRRACARKGRRFSWPRTRECMKLISADEVFAACKKILDKGK